ncbi:hypothetical protein LIPSTDRAFT_224440 [Lipomyces starkeyi NRRL Y-11557]|nr:hypothetical protein LIPSTDRAFT_224440 [Lipomyces starkeyi NRRL Y-11557]
MCFAVEGAKVLASRGIQARIVSFPCQRLFEKQSRTYKRSVLKRDEIPAVVVEAYAVHGWERYSDAGINMTTFGKSLPGVEAYRYFGFEATSVANKIEGYLRSLKVDESLRFEFQDL